MSHSAHSMNNADRNTASTVKTANTNGNDKDAGINYMTDSSPIVVGEIAPGCKKRDPIVVAENVRRSFGGINAVDVDYLEIPRHKITALIGPNGAGKTTLFNLLTGFDPPDRGKWIFEGKNLTGRPAFRIAQAGLVRT